MNETEYLKEVQKLNLWASAYYTNDKPLATDDEYDELYAKICEFEQNNPSLKVDYSPTTRIGGEILDGFNKSVHLVKMWSMEDIFNDNELLEWIKRGDKFGLEFYAEPKFDGASLNLLYKDGKLVKAATRGDGSVGEDVTLNAKLISSIPLQIQYKDEIEIRGEVVIAKKDFEEINSKRLLNNEPPLANPRNAAAGSLRQLDTMVVKSRKLKFYPWDVGKNSLNLKYHSEIMEFIRSLGFLRDEFCKICTNENEIRLAYNELLEQRNKKPMLMDGMVIRVNLLSKCEDLGYTVKFPKFMVAYKFPAIQKSARLIDVVLQVGRTGVVTPVGILDGVLIDGAFVKNVTLHNFDEIDRLGLMKNDIVSVIRSGDVIPKITEVYIQRRDGSQSQIIRPKLCPICQMELLDEGTLIKCQNLSCKARIISSIIYFASKKCMNIDGLSEATLQTLFDQKIIKNIADIYRLDALSFSGLAGFKNKKISNLLNAIEHSKNPTLERFITSLGIEHIGEVGAKKIVNKFKDKWLNLSNEELLSIDGFGETMVLSYNEFIKVNLDKINELLEFISPIISQTKTQNNIFSGKIIVITGTLSRPREEIKAELESFGAKVANSVSKKTDYVLYGDEARSKLTKAKELNIKTINENEYETLK